MAYLKWKWTKKKEDKIAFVELAKLFRKGRAGGSRTLLERRARAHFKEVKKHKNAENSAEGARKFNESLREEKRGVFSEESLSTRSELMRRTRAKQAAENDHPATKTYVVTTPEGEQLGVHGLIRYAKQVGIGHSEMHIAAKEPWRRKGSKGYTCVYFDPELHRDIPFAEGFELPPRLRKKYGLDDPT